MIQGSKDQKSSMGSKPVADPYQTGPLPSSSTIQFPKHGGSGQPLVTVWSFFCHFGEPAVTFGTISSVIIDNIELLLLLLIHATLYTLSNFNLNTSNILENINDDYLHIERACIIKYQYVWNTHFEYTVVEMQNNYV